MATVTPPRPAPQANVNLAPVDARLRSPLQRLRKYIRTYVLLEGVLLVLLFVALIFWVGLILDYGAFLLSSTLKRQADWWVVLDWAKVLPWWFRLAVLSILGGAAVTLIAMKVFRRLFIDFEDPSLALLLERRFPQLLGDRLITAVELSDPEACAALGYSPVMIRETIREAAQRVEKVPVGKVFDWKRLYRYGLAVLVLTLLVGSVALGAFCVRAVMSDRTAKHGTCELGDVASIWFERNILLKNVYWPRSAQLAVLEPTNPDLRMAANDPAPEVRVMALKYVIADDSAPEGWRQVTWHDLEERSSLIGSDLGTTPPGDWKPRQGDSITVDEIEARLNQFDVRKEVAGVTLPAKWNIADPRSETGWRPLNWSDLKPEYLGGVAIPPLSGRWFPSAEVVHAAQVVALGGFGPDCAPLQTAVLAMIAPQNEFLLEAARQAAKLDPKNKRTPQFFDATLDEIEQRLKGANDEWYLSHFNRPVLAAYGNKTETFDPWRMTRIASATMGTGDPTFLAGVHEWRISLGEVRYVFERLERLNTLRGVVQRVSARAAEPGMGRTLRELTLPKVVRLVYKGKDTTKRLELKKSSGEYVYSETMKGLEADKTRYWAVAEDFETDTRELTLLPPPQMVELLCEQYHPAYLYYRPASEDGKDLAGHKQRMEPQDFSSTSGKVTTISQVPGGSDVVLRVRVNRVLESRGEAVPHIDFVGSGNVPVPYQDLKWWGTTGDGFELTFKNVREKIHFTMNFQDENGVKGSREVEIAPLLDKAPLLDGIEPDTTVRRMKAARTYMVTASARVPFQGVIRDDQGLARVRFHWTLREEKLGTEALQANTVTIFGLPIKLPEEIEAPAAPSEVHSLDMAGFAARKTKEENFLGPEQVRDWLSRAKKYDYRDEKAKPLLKRFKLEPDSWTEPINKDEEKDPKKWEYLKAEDSERNPLRCDFPVWDLEDKTGKKIRVDRTKTQRHYRLQLWLEAVDTDLDSDKDKKGNPQPHSGSSERFNFQVVSENVLVAEISEEENKIFTRFDEMVKSMEAREAKLREVVLKLDEGTLKPGEDNTFDGELNGILGSLGFTAAALDKAAETALGVRKDYERIQKELRINQVETTMSRVTNGVINPLLEIEKNEFPEAKEALRSFVKAVDLVKSKKMNNVAQVTDSTRAAANNAQMRVKQLNEKLKAVLRAMEKIQGIADLVKRLVELEKKQMESEEIYKQIQRQLIEDNFGKP